MKKLILLSLYASFALSATFINPLPSSSKALENGGTLSAIDAYKDGVGAMVVNNGRGVDNSVMNSLVFKYGNEAKSNNINLGDQVLLSGTAEDKLLAGKLYPDGENCSDGNANTTGETWLNGVCQGGNISLNVTANGLLQYDNCESGAKNLADATSYCTSKGMRLPVMVESSYIDINGVPQCSGTSYTWTSTPDASFVYGGYYVWSLTYYTYVSNSFIAGVRCVK